VTDDWENSFSDLEKEVIEYLVSNPDMSHQDIADELDVSRGTVNKSVARIKEKTRTSFATLLESPYTKKISEEVDENKADRLTSYLQQTGNQ
jgi:DNA-binding MurR/RpiR family transcriptional regulator